MSGTTQIRLRQLHVIIVAWTIMGFFITLHDHLVIQSGTTDTTGEYSFLISLLRNMGAGFAGALMGGSLLVFYVNPRYQDKPYLYTVLIVLVSFILIVAIISAIMGLILVPIRTGKPLSAPGSRNDFLAFLKERSHIKAAIVWSFVVATTQLMLQISAKFGLFDFWNILRGKYNKPKEEKRIFMFLDLNSSTTIAERLGDEHYHALLKDFFADITDPILENKGSIYQYVGDEVVISWQYEEGKANNHCVRCFFDMKRRIRQLKHKYLQRYGFVPSFKAALHCGDVVAGEVGIIKRDITFSGDVLNTASRILGKCSELNEEIIASAELLSAIHSMNDFVSRPLGAVKLRGKEKEVCLNALLPAVNNYRLN